MSNQTKVKDCPVHKIRLETKKGNYKTQQFRTVEPYCPICEGEQE